MSATIDPGTTSMVVRRDPRIRLEDYERSLRAWLGSGSVSKIVMFENSGYDIGSLKTIAAEFRGCEVEFHSFAANQSGTSRGKGHSELLGISRTMSQSRLIRGCELVVKCTGRLTIANSAGLLPLVAARDFDVMCTLKHHLSFADTRFFVATPEFLENYLIPQGEMINDAEGLFLEHALACATARAVADRKTWRPFPAFPVIRGISGTYGTPIADSLPIRLLKATLHKFRNVVYAK